MYSCDVILIVSGLFVFLGCARTDQNDNNGETKQLYPSATANNGHMNVSTEQQDEEYGQNVYEYYTDTTEKPVPCNGTYIGRDDDYDDDYDDDTNFAIGAKRVVSLGGHHVSAYRLGHSMLWHVGVYSKRFRPYMQICGGTLVTTRAVISAAHCFWSDVEGAMPAEDFAVGAGKLYRPWDVPQDKYSQKSDVAAIHIPVRYRDAATSYQEDIAVLLLAEEFMTSRAVRPACVNFDEDFDNEQLKEGNVGTVLGWGLTKEDGDPSQILNYLELPAVSIEECLNSTDEGFLRYITSDKICAGVTTGKALCRGDSGGGLVFVDQAGDSRVPYLRGVASTAPKNEHRCNAHALAALTHVRAHRAFLRRYIPNLEDECKWQYPLANDFKVSSMTLRGCDDDVLQDIDHAPQCQGFFACLGCARTDQNDNDGETTTETSNYARMNGSTDQQNRTSDHDYYDPYETDEDVALYGGDYVELFDEKYSGAHSMLWHVGVYSKRFTPYKQICGGTLVTTRAVISAAHCFWSDVEGAMPAEDFAVGAGKRYRPWDVPRDQYSQKSDVAAIHIPIGYRGHPNSFQQDIAVLLLAEEFMTSRAVRPACVNFEEHFDKAHLKEGNLGTVLGWGLTKEDGHPSQILNYLELPAVSIEECLNSTDAGFLRYITIDKICAGVTTGKALCKGDSGGGLVFRDRDSSTSVPYLRGVASTAPRNNDHQCNTHALAALTHVRAHRAFLQRYIPNLEAECERQYPSIDTIKIRYSPDEPATSNPNESPLSCYCNCNNTKTFKVTFPV